MSNKVELSVVIPLYNEEESIGPLYEELSSALDSLNRTYEVIIVDDGSTHAILVRLTVIHARDPRWKVIRFRRNYGQTAGLSAGFEAAQGDIVITQDGDLQNDPRDIPKLLARLEEGYDIVSGWRKD